MQLPPPPTSSQGLAQAFLFGLLGMMLVRLLYLCAKRAALRWRGDGEHSPLKVRSPQHSESLLESFVPKSVHGDRSLLQSFVAAPASASRRRDSDADVEAGLAPAPPAAHQFESFPQRRAHDVEISEDISDTDDDSVVDYDAWSFRGEYQPTARR